MLRTACSLVFVCLLATAAPVAAQQQKAAADLPAKAGSHSTLSESASAPQPLFVASAPDSIPVASAPDSIPMASAFRRKQDRPAPLIPLYASFATLQALDYASTTRALANGAGREANPVMRGIVNNRAAFIAVKAAAATGVILAGEKMWKKNRVAAVIFVAAANGAIAAVVARNYSIR
jgi:hypothetical protein